MEITLQKTLKYPKFSFSFVFKEINRQLFAVVEKRKMAILLKDFLRKMATVIFYKGCCRKNLRMFAANNSRSECTDLVEEFNTELSL